MAALVRVEWSTAARAQPTARRPAPTKVQRDIRGSMSAALAHGLLSAIVCHLPFPWIIKKILRKTNRLYELVQIEMGLHGKYHLLNKKKFQIGSTSRKL